MWSVELFNDNRVYYEIMATSVFLRHFNKTSFLLNSVKRSSLLYSANQRLIKKSYNYNNFVVARVSIKKIFLICPALELRSFPSLDLHLHNSQLTTYLVTLIVHFRHKSFHSHKTQRRKELLFDCCVTNHNLLASLRASKMGRTERERRKKRRQTSDPPPPSIHHDLYKFLSGRGWRNANHLRVSAFPLTGRGLFAKKTLSEHETIIELPHQAMLAYHTIENDKNFIGIFNGLESAKSKVTFQSLLALYLQHQKLKAESSEWISYLKTLPEAFTAPFFCEKSELYLLPENILQKVVEQNSVIKRDFQELMMLVKDEERDNFTLNSFKWAYFVCNSRSVYVNGKSLEPLVDRLVFKELLCDAPNMALAPLLDLLNHSDKALTKSQLSHSDGFIAMNFQKIKNGEVQLNYQLQTLRNVKKFEQIFINYGTLNNTKLLLEYGFTLPDNQMDFLEFSLDDINNYVKEHTLLRTLQIPKHKYKFIRDHDLDQQMFIDVNDGLSHSFQAVLAILLVPQNIYNLTQVAFGDEINFNDIRHHAIEILKRKKFDFQTLSDGLEKRSSLSGSGRACLEYFCESMKLVDKVLNSVENYNNFPGK